MPPPHPWFARPVRVRERKCGLPMSLPCRTVDLVWRRPPQVTAPPYGTPLDMHGLSPGTWRNDRMRRGVLPAEEKGNWQWLRTARSISRRPRRRWGGSPVSAARCGSSSAVSMGTTRSSTSNAGGCHCCVHPADMTPPVGISRPPRCTLTLPGRSLVFSACPSSGSAASRKFRYWLTKLRASAASASRQRSTSSITTYSSVV